MGPKYDWKCGDNTGQMSAAVDNREQQEGNMNCGGTKCNENNNGERPSFLRRRKVETQQKLTLLSFIRQRKDIIFGQFSTNKNKANAWEEVRLEAISLGICNADRTRSWVRDKLFGVWKSRCLERRDTSRKSGKGKNLSEVDRMIYDIIGEEQPVVGIVEQGTDKPVNNNNNDQVDGEENGQFIVLNNEEDHAENDHGEDSSKKRERSECDELLGKKLRKQLELLDVEIYKRKLECLKLERELNVQRSKFTRQLVTHY